MSFGTTRARRELEVMRRVEMYNVMSVGSPCLRLIVALLLGGTMSMSASAQEGEAAAGRSALPEDGAIRVLIRADDMGGTHAGNEACLRAYREGIVRSVEVIVPGPWFLEAVKMLNENAGLDAGVHLALTSEWDLCKWRPLTQVPSLVDDNGYFHPNVGEPGKPGSGFLAANPKPEEIERELRAQIELARRHIANLTHLSTHMFDPRATPELLKIVLRLSDEYDLPIHIDGMRHVGGLGDWPNTTAEEKEAAFAAHLEKLTPGLWMFLEHPGLDVPEMRALAITPWYPNVAADRDGITRLFTSDRIKQIIERRGIQLVSYGDVIRERRAKEQPR